VTPADFTGRKEVVPLQRRAGERGDAELSFEFRKQRFCYDDQADAFHKLKYPTQARRRLVRRSRCTRALSLRLRGPARRHRSLSWHALSSSSAVLAQSCARRVGCSSRCYSASWDWSRGWRAGAPLTTRAGAQETFETYRRSSGLGSEARAAAALEHWGANRFEVPLPQFADLLKEQLMAPFFVFQVFCVGLWCLDDYWRAAPRRASVLRLSVVRAVSGVLRWHVVPGESAGAPPRPVCVLRLGSVWAVPCLLRRPAVPGRQLSGRLAAM